MGREILVNWTTASGGGKVSVLNFHDTSSVVAQRAAINTFYDALASVLSNQVSWSIAQSGREFNNATGALTGEWSDSTNHVGAGSNTGQSVADASQVLIRWNSGVVVGGRFVKGRTYIPGLSVANLSSGNLSSSANTVFANAAAAFLATSGVEFAVYHRPVNGAGGQLLAAESATVWNELAVLLRRRS